MLSRLSLGEDGSLKEEIKGRYQTYEIDWHRPES